tara:strand:- start:187 stop:417 length:231 start_codon:yes stop_codon:yes gene_type:complete
MEQEDAGRHGYRRAFRHKDDSNAGQLRSKPQREHENVPDRLDYTRISPEGRERRDKLENANSPEASSQAENLRYGY